MNTKMVIDFWTGLKPVWKYLAFVVVGFILGLFF